MLQLTRKWSELDLRRVFLILSLIWTFLMGYLLLSPGTGLPSYKFFEGQDKVAHLILFTTWIFLWLQVFRGAVVFIVVGGIIVAGFTEWLQYFIPYRAPDIYDFVLDLVGIVIGCLLGVFAKKELFGT